MSAWNEVLDFLLSTPTPETIIKFRLSLPAQDRIRYLNYQFQHGNLTGAEKVEFAEAVRVNHLLNSLKKRARDQAADV